MSGADQGKLQKFVLFSHRYIAVGVGSLALIAGGYFLHSSAVLMYYGPWSPEENRFDATQWFRSGMYRPRLMGNPPQASPDSMLRSEPEHFKPIQNDDILARTLLAMEQRFPGVDTEDLVLNTPDLSRRIRYAFSTFAEPDRPQDAYWLFLSIEGRDYVITMEWDVKDKVLVSGATAELLGEGSDAEIEYRRLVKELGDASVSKR